MINYASLFNSSGAFPNILAINVTAPAAGDGTELLAAGVNDSWGFHQAIMDYGLNGVVPDTVTEAPGTSQMLEAMQNAFGHPGEVVGWHGQADPATLGIRLLLLEKQGVLRATYPDLDAAVYVGDGNNPTFPYYYHADDAAGAVRNTAGIYLILPDSRGCTIRGSDPTNLRDPLGSVRLFPDIQIDAMEQHGHTLQSNTGNFFAVHIGDTLAAGTDKFWVPAAAAGADALEAKAVSGATIDNNETRMTNLGIKLCVRY